MEENACKMQQNEFMLSCRVSRQKSNLPRLGRLLIAVCFIFVSTVSAQAEPAKRPIKLTAEDYAEIYNLYSQYSETFDTGDTEGRIAVFAPNGTMDSYLSDHVPYSMEKMRDMMKNSVRKPRPVGGHLLTNIHITPTADGVDATCYAMLGGGTPDAHGKYIADPAFYTDKLVKTPLGWRFKSREVWLAEEEYGVKP